MFTVASQPEGGISLLVLDVNVSAVSQDELDELEVTLVGCDGQGGVLGTRNRSSIHVSTLTVDHSNHDKMYMYVIIQHTYLYKCKYCTYAYAYSVHTSNYTSR